MTKIEDFVAGRSPPELYETYLRPGLFQPWADELAALASPGQKCLDIACGTGVVARSLTARWSNEISIAAIDIAAPMIVEAKKRTPAGAVDYRVAAADALPFEDSLFDIAFCQQGLQFIPDKEKALSEAARCLKKGGRLAISVWAPVEDGAPVFDAFSRSIANRLGEDLAPIGPFSFGGKDRLDALAKGAGFTIETLETRTKEACLPSIEDLVLFDVLFLGRPTDDGEMQPVLAPEDPASDRMVTKIIEDMTEALGEYIQPDGRLRAPISAHFLLAQK